MKCMSIDEIIISRNRLITARMNATSELIKYRLGVKISNMTKKIEESKVIHFEESKGDRDDLQHTKEALRMWSAGLCGDRTCNAEARSMGACTCWNIAQEKQLDMM